MTPSEAAAGAPAHALGIVETDACCEQCGFNLHGQRIWRDERLALPVARCPECGRHHAVGKSTSSASPWLGRLALLGLLVWLMLGVAFVVASFGVCLGWQAGASEVLLQRNFETVDGEPVYMTWNRTGRESPGPKWVRSRAWASHGEPLPDSEADRLVPADRVRFRVRPSHVLSPPPGVTFGELLRSETIWILALLVAGAALSVVVIGVIAASAFWFWRPVCRVSWLALPLLAAIVIGVIEWTNLGSTYAGRVGLDGGIPFVGVGLIPVNIGIVAALQVLCIAIGLRFGRPVVRLLLNIFIPPRARQAFAFLWHCDGKTMPLAYTPRGQR